MNSVSYKSLKKIIIICVVAIVIIILLLAFLLNTRTDDNKEDKEIDENITNSAENENQTIVEDNEIINMSNGDPEETNNDYEVENGNNSLIIISDNNEYFKVKQCIDSYYSLVDDIYVKSRYENNDNKQLDKDTLNCLYNLIDDEAKSTLRLNNNNIQNLYNNYENTKYFVDAIYCQNISNAVNVYAIQGRIIKNLSNGNVEKYDMFIKMDKVNSTYSIYPYEFLIQKAYNDVSIIEAIDIQNYQELKDNGFNTYSSVQKITEQDLALEYFQAYKNCLIYDRRHLYDLLYKDYKDINFRDFEEFNSYINDNYEKLTRTVLSKYVINDQEQYTEYECIDDQNNYIKFIVTDCMQYKVMLDNYTIMSQDQIQIYTQSTDQAKARYCIQRFMYAVNAKNYNFLYSVLDENYKNQLSVDDYKNTIQNIFNGQIKYEIMDYIQGNDGTHQYTVKLTNNQNITSEIKFIIKLKNETYFEAYLVK